VSEKLKENRLTQRLKGAKTQRIFADSIDAVSMAQKDFILSQAE
jgi:hypothetical protein